MNLTDQSILAALQGALEPQEWCQAMWRAGAAAFRRVDRWSDLDLMIVVDDERVEDALALIDAAVAGLGQVELRWRLPQPTWHGHEQVFYRLKEAGPYLLLDIVVLKLSSQEKFLQPELHGQAQVLFDKAGVVSWPPFDWDDLHQRLAARLETLRVTFDLFQPFTLKELHRGQLLDALAYYQGLTLRPLVEALRIRHDPARFSFGSRYLYQDLPADVAARLEPLFLVASAEDLRDKHRQAGEWFAELVEK
jgi:hypothetical protein